MHIMSANRFPLTADTIPLKSIRACICVCITQICAQITQRDQWWK